MKEKFSYVPPSERKKILLLCDDIRSHSGVGTVSREIVLNTCQHFNWVNVGAAIQHPEQGKRIDISKDTADLSGVDDAQIIIYPWTGYGDVGLIRQLMKTEKPDAIFLITDPRYFTWLFQIENEIRKQIPIVYLNIWDDLPAPHYNKAYYESCDMLLGISKQTVFINNEVLGDKAQNKLIKYLPHGLNHNLFFPITPSYEKYKEFKMFKSRLLKKEFDFVAFFNSRNIRRKQIPDTIWAFKEFVDKLPEEKAKKTALLLHTQKVDNNGTDLPAVVEMLCGDNPKYNIIFDETNYPVEEMNWLYNCADVQIQLTSNEGWGLSLTEAMLAGRPIIANVTGGMQDQMRFTDEKGNWFTPTKEVPSNHRGTYKQHAAWAFPVYPTNISIVGSPPTPYIFDDRCDPLDAADRLYEVYNLGFESRKQFGQLARNWATGGEAGFTAEKQGERVIEAIDELFKTWKPRCKFELIKVEEREIKQAKHKLVY
jgi:glycosyltransferase involved in cell wall biosynthesis